MSTFCGGNGNIPSMTTAEINASFSHEGKTGLLPSSLSELAIGADGLASDSELQAYVTRLQAQKKIPQPPQIETVSSAPGGSPDSVDPLAKYTSDMRQFTDLVKLEYCHYESRYFAAVDRFLQSIANSSIGTKSSDDVEPSLNLARTTNQRLTLYTQIINAISKFNYGQTLAWNNDINNMNHKFKENAINLEKQAEILNKSTAAADLHKRMVTYTIEKNKANSNLLSLYTVLNVSAIAMLIYISRAQ